MHGIRTSPDLAPGPPLHGVGFDLRAFLRERPYRGDRRRLIACLAACLLVHVAILVPLDPRGFAPETVEEPIPVEVIVEPPPPEPEAKAEEEPKPPEPAPETPKQLDEKPANDYARASDDEQATGKDAPPPPPQETAAAAAAPPTEPPAPDGLEPPQADAPPAPTPPLPPVRKTPTYAFLPALPNIEFKTPAKKTNDPKGSADPGYLTTLYAKIMQNMHAPRPPAVAPNYRGRVVFGVLSDGRIIQVALAAPSGFRELDEAALAAVRKGAPYPRPPNGGPVYIRFDYGTR